MVIELIGTPGAGKTTLIPAIVGSLRERGIEAFTVVDAARPYAQRTFWGKVVHSLAPRSLHRPLLWQLFYRLSTLYRLLFAIKHPRLIWQVLSSQLQRPEAADVRQRKVLHWYFRLTGYYEFLRGHARSGEALVFDEGFVHRVVQLFASSVEEPDKAQVRAYIDLLVQPDLVVFARTPWQTCKRRIVHRGLWQRASHKSPAEISEFVFNAHLAVNLAVDHMKSKGWNIIEVDNDSPDPMIAKTDLSFQLAQILSIGSEVYEVQSVL